MDRVDRITGWLDAHEPLRGGNILGPDLVRNRREDTLRQDFCAFDTGPIRRADAELELSRVDERTVITTLTAVGQRVARRLDRDDALTASLEQLSVQEQTTLLGLLAKVQKALLEPRKAVKEKRRR